ncbi:biotin/lipoyl-containing protein [Streptomyces sp. NPDC048481]|uniref:biotin/lipoyl-containing protein n=1 Tax=Streptomyces sp. NPDC048481 TaxID=3365557 RepID=UPI00371603BF
MGDPTPILVPQAPAPGEQWDQNQVLVSRIHVSVGDPVQHGQAVADLETNKVSLELDSPVQGVVSDVRVRPDETVPLGTTLMIIDAGAPAPPLDQGKALRVPDAPGPGAAWGQDRVTVSAVHVSAGGHAERGQPLVEIGTSTAVQGGTVSVKLEMTSPVRGTIVRISAQVGSTVPVGSALLFIEPDLTPLPAERPTPVLVPQTPAPGEQWDQDQLLVSRIRVTVGDRVESGQAVADVETSKISLGLDSPVPGVVSELRVAAGDTVPAGAVLMVIDADA